VEIQEMSPELNEQPFDHIKCFSIVLQLLKLTTYFDAVFDFAMGYSISTENVAKDLYQVLSELSFLGLDESSARVDVVFALN